MECSICGISEKMRSVFEVISSKGIVLACDKCASEEGFPRLKKPDKKVFEEPERKGSVYERMARLSGVQPREQERPELKKQEESLRKIIDRNYEEKMRRQDLTLKSRPDLTDNFHWIIMRVRRVKGLTQKQLAEMIGESEAAIKMAEQGVVPAGYELIDKIQRFLRVKLIKERTSSRLGQSKERDLYSDKVLNKNKNHSNMVGIRERNQQIPSQSQKQKTLSFARKNLDSLTIDDLQRMKRERETEETEAESYEEDYPADEDGEQQPKAL